MARRPKPAAVDAFLAGLDHGRLGEIEKLRAAILAADQTITERIKWNAPSFCWQGDDRVTFRLQPGDRVELVLHRGVAKRPPDDFSFDDPTGLVAWATADRGVIVLADAAATDAALPHVVELVRRWMAATAEPAEPAEP